MSLWMYSKNLFRAWDKGFSQPAGCPPLGRLRGAGPSFDPPQCYWTDSLRDIDPPEFQLSCDEGHI
jgi:hypothetical protein